MFLPHRVLLFLVPHPCESNGGSLSTLFSVRLWIAAQENLFPPRSSAWFFPPPVFFRFLFLPPYSRWCGRFDAAVGTAPIASSSPTAASIPLPPPQFRPFPPFQVAGMHVPPPPSASPLDFYVKTVELFMPCQHFSSPPPTRALSFDDVMLIPPNSYLVLFSPDLCSLSHDGVFWHFVDRAPAPAERPISAEQPPISPCFLLGA